MRHIGWIWISLPLAACATVVEPATPKAAFANEPRVIAINTSFALSTSWEGVCRTGSSESSGSRWGLGPLPTESCNRVKYDLTVKCDDDACTLKRMPDGVSSKVFEITPIKLGTLRVYAVMNPKFPGEETETIALPPVEVVKPDAAAVRCVIWDRDAELDVEILANRRKVDTLWPDFTIKANGEECVTSKDIGGTTAYRCKQSQAVDVEVVAKGWNVKAKAECSVVLPTLSPRLEGAAFLHSGSPKQLSALVEKTRDDLAGEKWNVVSTTELGDRAVIVASKLHTTVEIVMTERKLAGEEESEYKWTWNSKQGSAIAFGGPTGLRHW
jgi:hypothetical protein